MDQQQVKEKYSSYENVKAFFGFSYIAINWICHNFKVEKICKILIWKADSKVECLRKKRN